LGASEVFTLTYIPDFFRRFGFEEVDRGELPHKVWLDCVKCPKFPDCGETAMKRALRPGAAEA
ncbi:MAG: GNAT family N-acetyltransferase, partial [Planctomycetota bacterium]|nr:GNAT family N-acetyltransferase [Planctomycetota bacterium]